MKLSSTLIIFGFVLIAGAIVAGCKKKSEVVVSSSADRAGKVVINDKTYSIELARTAAEQQQGLSNRDQIGSDGMLFVFDRSGKPGFWMIDMKFDLDFIWISGGKVSEITHDVKKPLPGQKPSELPNYFPHQSVDMMLEVNAGFAEREKMNVGDSVKLISN